MAKNVKKWSKIFIEKQLKKIIKYASEWLKMVENGLKHVKMAQNVSKA